MRQLAAALLLAWGATAGAQPFFLGDPVPLTDTRYGAFGVIGSRVLASSTEPFLLWSSVYAQLRITKLVDGERRVGRPVLDSGAIAFDGVWTGDRFLVAARIGNGIAGQFVDANGEALNAPFPIAQRQPTLLRLAYDGTRTLMVTGPELEAAVLDRDGQIVATPSVHGTANDIAAASIAGAFAIVSAELDEVHVLTLTDDGAIYGNPRFAVPALADRRVAIASSGSEFLIVWTNGSAPLEAAILRASNATITGRFTIANTDGASAVAAAREGTRWVVSYVTGGAAHVMRIDTANGAEERLSSKPADDQSHISVASVNGRTVVAWNGADRGSLITVRDLAGTTDLAAFAAAEQVVESTAATAESALIIFGESRDGHGTLYAGLRGHDGSWRETPLEENAESYLAATDGNGFAVILSTSEFTEWWVALIDHRGRVVNRTSHVPSFTPTGVAWTGDAYAVVGINGDGNLAAYRVSPSGIVSAPMVLAQHRPSRFIEAPTIAARDGEVLVVWQDSAVLGCSPPCDLYESQLLGARFTPALQRIDMSELLLAPDEATYPAVVWDGTHYVIAWNDKGHVEWRTLRSNGAVSGITRIENLEYGSEPVRISTIPGGVAITRTNGDVVLLYQGQTYALTNLGPAGSAAVVALGNRIGYVYTQRRDEMPYHGAYRVQLRVGDTIVPAALPNAPRITRSAFLDGVMELAWTRPAGSINGYRVEYRVDDGSWNELDEWFDAEETSLSIRPWRTNVVRYQFRIRALNDAGTGAYSNAASLLPLNKRRSMR